MKYELVHNDTIEIQPLKKVTRIRALRDIPLHGVRRGDLGGYIETVNNLAQDGDAWVAGRARVYGDSSVLGDALVSDRAIVLMNACVRGQAKVFGDARVFGNALIFGNAEVFDDAEISGSARILGNARISHRARVTSHATISGKCSVNPIFVQGLAWDITIVDDSMHIGCTCLALIDWYNHNRDTALELHQNGDVIWDAYSKVLFDLGIAAGRWTKDALLPVVPDEPIQQNSNF